MHNRPRVRLCSHPIGPWDFALKSKSQERAKTVLNSMKVPFYKDRVLTREEAHRIVLANTAMLDGDPLLTPTADELVVLFSPCVRHPTVSLSPWGRSHTSLVAEATGADYALLMDSYINANSDRVSVFHVVGNHSSIVTRGGRLFPADSAEGVRLLARREHAVLNIAYIQTEEDFVPVEFSGSTHSNGDT